MLEFRISKSLSLTNYPLSFREKGGHNWKMRFLFSNHGFYVLRITVTEVQILKARLLTCTSMIFPEGEDFQSLSVVSEKPFANENVRYHSSGKTKLGIHHMV